MPTNSRVISSNREVSASPDPALARLQAATPRATIRQRGTRSANQPNTGAVTMYVTRKAVASAPVFASASGSSARKKALRISGSTARECSGRCSEEIDAEQQRQRTPSALAGPVCIPTHVAETNLCSIPGATKKRRRCASWQRPDANLLCGRAGSPPRGEPAGVNARRTDLFHDLDAQVALSLEVRGNIEP